MVHRTNHARQAISSGPPNSLIVYSISRTTIKSFKFAVSFQGISRMGSAFSFLRWLKLAHTCIQATRFHTGEEFESISKFLIGNRFHATLRIVGPTILEKKRTKLGVRVFPFVYPVYSGLPLQQINHRWDCSTSCYPHRQWGISTFWLCTNQKCSVITCISFF